MGKFLKILLCLVVVDFFFFSTRINHVTQGFNTKELMAVVGIFLFGADLYVKREFAVTREFIGLLLFSVTISLLAIFSTVYHNTPERTFTTYFMSMLTWLSAAFVAVSCIKAVHKKLTIELLCSYIVAVAVIQGLIAVIADNFAPLDSFILRTIPGSGWSKRVGRLYGFGETATFDTAGIRFAIASILCSHNIKALAAKQKTKSVPIFILAFILLTVTGNMVARTTLVGTIIGLIYMILFISPFKVNVEFSTLKTWLWLFLEILAIVILMSFLYRVDDNFRFRTRFAFEGFFSLAEKGEWGTGSNEKLKRMYVFPDNLETWVIGDGYMIGAGRDPNYIGEKSMGFYKDTDVGYLRLIFFFGLIGLSVYSAFIIYAGIVCIRMHPENWLLFLALTATHFIVWLKVSTDCFFILCLFICLGYLKEGMAPETVS